MPEVDVAGGQIFSSLHLIDAESLDRDSVECFSHFKHSQISFNGLAIPGRWASPVGETSDEPQYGQTRRVRSLWLARGHTTLAEREVPHQQTAAAQLARVDVTGS